MQDFKFTWKIENFNFLPPQRGKALKSPSFNVSLLGSTVLELYPKGDILDPDGESIIICLNNCTKIPHLSVTCDVQMVIGEASPVHYSTEKIHECTKWRFKKEPQSNNQHFFTAESQAEDFCKCTLIVTCNFSQSPEMAKTNMKLNSSINKDMALLSKDMETIYIDQQFSDITLKAGNQNFPVHKAVLQARLPKLVKDIESDSEPRKVTDMEPSVLKLLLQYAYSGKISATETNLPGGLYEAANNLQLHDLKYKLYSYPTEVTARTCIKVGRNVFTWPITDIQSMELNRKIYSPTFTDGVIKGSDLKLACYLGKSAEGKQTLEICVHRLFPDKNNPIFVRCKITVINQLTLFRCAEHVFVSDEEWHFPSFIPINQVESQQFDGSSVMYFTNLANHGVPLKCELSVSGCEISDTEETTCLGTRYENFVRLKEDVRSLCSDLGQLYNIFLPKVSDVKLLIGDVRFPAHKVILAARSPVFARMFANDMIEKASGVVKITDIDIAVLNIMLTYIYSAKVDILNYDNAVQLYSAADKYEVTSLKERCAAYMKDSLDTENACDILVLADMHGDKDLKEFTQKFFYAHADTIMEKEEWKNLMENHIELASEIMHFLMSEVLQHRRDCHSCNK